jgi:IPT/TIG domain
VTWYPPTGAAPLRVVVVPGPAGAGPGWFPPTPANPLPVVLCPPADVSVEGYFPPSRANPLPCNVVAGAAPPSGVEGWYPTDPPNAIPCVLITGSIDNGVTGWFPPTPSNPLPVCNIGPAIPPQPVIGQLQPNSIGANTATPIVVVGTGFIDTSVVNLGGANQPSEWLDSDHLAFTSPALDAATYQVVVITPPAPEGGGGTSNSVALTVSPIPPQPVILQLQPNSIEAHTVRTIVVVGTGFTDTSVVRLGGVNQPSEWLDINHLAFATPALNATTYQVVVITPPGPAGGGGTSNSVALTVTPPVPSLIGSVMAVTHGGPEQPLTTAPINTTGADLLVISLGWFGGGPAPTVSDSAGNVWVPSPVGSITSAGTGGGAVGLWYRQSPITSAAHTFTVTPGTREEIDEPTPRAIIYPTIYAAAWRGSAGGGGVDKYSSARSASGASLAGGSLIPTNPNSIFISAAVIEQVPTTISISPGIVDQSSRGGIATSWAGGLGHLVGSVASNLTWSWTGATANGAAVINLVFAPAL